MDYEMGYWSSWPSLPLQATPLGWGQRVVVQMVESSWLVKKVVRQKEKKKIPSIFLRCKKSGVVMSSTEDELVRQLAQHTDLSSLASFNSSIHPYQFDFIIEHERGIKLFGIPLFSHKSLWPIIDPSHYQSISGKKLSIPISLENYPLPDFDWQWQWDRWYVFMFNDVDPHGWMYSNVFFQCAKWKGKYYFGNTVRKRIWIRLRKKCSP